MIPKAQTTNILLGVISPQQISPQQQQTTYKTKFVVSKNFLVPFYPTPYNF